MNNPSQQNEVFLSDVFGLGYSIAGLMTLSVMGKNSTLFQQEEILLKSVNILSSKVDIQLDYVAEIKISRGVDDFLEQSKIKEKLNTRYGNSVTSILEMGIWLAVCPVAAGYKDKLLIFFEKVENAVIKSDISREDERSIMRILNELKIISTNEKLFGVKTQKALISIGNMLQKYPLILKSVTKILFLSADPTNASRLRIGEELREIQEKLQLGKIREKFILEQRLSVRPTDFCQALLDIQPRIIHFSGHGTAAGELCLENQIGEIHPIQPDALASLFEQFTNQVSCVILNACYSEIQATAIAHHIDYVIGMNKAIGDKAAIAFAIGFYQALGAGRTIEEAYKLGCVHIKLLNIPEHLTPILIKKGQKLK